MKKIFKYSGYGVLSLILVATVFTANLLLQPYDKLRIYLSLGPEVEVRMNDGLAYRDLNKNQRLDIKYTSYKLVSARS